MNQPDRAEQEQEMTLATKDLHGHAYTPFVGFDEETVYMEAETTDQRREARHRMVDFCELEDEHLSLPRSIFMRWVTGAEAAERSRCENDECWLECPEDHPDAVRFWKAEF